LGFVLQDATTCVKIDVMCVTLADVVPVQRTHRETVCRLDFILRYDSILREERKMDAHELGQLHLQTGYVFENGTMSARLLS
jgi:hypothetical protein